MMFWIAINMSKLLAQLYYETIEWQYCFLELSDMTYVKWQLTHGNNIIHNIKGVNNLHFLFMYDISWDHHF